MKTPIILSEVEFYINRNNDFKKGLLIDKIYRSSMYLIIEQCGNIHTIPCDRLKTILRFNVDVTTYLNSELK